MAQNSTHLSQFPWVMTLSWLSWVLAQFLRLHSRCWLRSQSHLRLGRPFPSLRSCWQNFVLCGWRMRLEDGSLRLPVIPCHMALSVDTSSTAARDGVCHTGKKESHAQWSCLTCGYAFRGSSFPGSAQFGSR